MRFALHNNKNYSSAGCKSPLILIVAVSAFVITLTMRSCLSFVPKMVHPAGAAALLGRQQHRQNLFQPRSMLSRRSYYCTSSSLMMAGDGVICATHDEILAAIKNPDTVILDVRSVDEVLNDGYLRVPAGDNIRLRYIHSPCTKDTAPILSVAAEDMIPDKNVPILVYCGVGYRASKAKEVLDAKGYTNVLNGGGLSDLDFLRQK
jgi:phage shock protein E